MQSDYSNPFQITKAVDFSDDEIKAYWVDFPIEGGFSKIVSPRSAMPMFILGGKGSGKTHLMRYFSYNLQLLRYNGDLLNCINKEGYLGIYLRCGGLNASRFMRKGQPDDRWSTIFSFYMDLSMTQLLLATICDLYNDSSEIALNEEKICQNILKLFDHEEKYGVKKLSELVNKIDEIRKRIDVEINNCAITGSLNVKILASPGKLVFGTPQILSKMLPSLRSIIFVYLLDEFENLNKDQQKYINTLVREKEPPATFKIGVRLYGIKTSLTYSADEEIKQGSEYEKIVLDSQFREKAVKSLYRPFVSRLCLKRINKLYYTISDSVNGVNPIAEFGEYFEHQAKSDYDSTETKELVSKYKPKERPYIRRLEKQLKEAAISGTVCGVKENEDIKKILNSVLCEDYPILEKLNIFMLYQKWSKNNNLVNSCSEIEKSCSQFILAKSEEAEYSQLYKHWHKDLLAQLYRDCDRRMQYSGIETIIDMSHGLPRNLLIILKCIYKWSIFNGEKPFTKDQISIKSQMQGIKEASEWFFQDARSVGESGSVLSDSISRLAQLFRECRFSDKPSEVSLNSFSTDLTKVSKKAQITLDLAVKWSLLVLIPGGQKDKNSKRLDQKYQLNRMLSPRWDLPIARRGVISLNANEVNAIFDDEHSNEFEEILKVRIDRMSAPFGVKQLNTECKKQMNLF